VHDVEAAAAAAPRRTGPHVGPRALIAGQALLALAFAGWAIAQQHPRLPWDGSYEIRVDLADASGLTKASPRGPSPSRGVAAGKVEDVRYDAANRPGRRAAAPRRRHPAASSTPGRMRPSSPAAHSRT